MTEFIYTTSTNISGPWLVDADKNDEWIRITKYQEAIVQRKINREIEEYKLGYYINSYIKDDDKRKLEIQSYRNNIETRVRTESIYENNRSITIHLKGNKKIIVKSFSEALRQHSLLEEMPIGFSTVIQSGEIKGQLELTKTGRLDISVSPELLPESRELFAALQRWASTVRPPKWQKSGSTFNLHNGLSG